MDSKFYSSNYFVKPTRAKQVKFSRNTLRKKIPRPLRFFYTTSSLPSFISFQDHQSACKSDQNWLRCNDFTGHWSSRFIAKTEIFSSFWRWHLSVHLFESCCWNFFDFQDGGGRHLGLLGTGLLFITGLAVALFKPQAHQISWNSVHWFESYCRFMISKMAAATILDFTTNENSSTRLAFASSEQHSNKISWKSIQWFESYWRFSISKMATAAILDLRKLNFRDHDWISLHESNIYFRFHENWSIGSKVTAIFGVREFGWDFSIWGFWGQFLGVITP